VAGLTLFLLVLAVIAMLVLPMWLIRPFAPQTPDGIALSFALRRWAPIVTVLILIIGLALTVRLWRGGRWWSRALAVLALVPLGAAAFFSRQNIFEKMFAPVGQVASVPAAEASWVEDGDPVLAVTLNGDAAAYPVRQISYHHIVEDTVGGIHVAVTY
jgi:thiol:disulfide interchange protein